MPFHLHLRHNLTGRLLFLCTQLFFNTLFIRLLGPHGNGQLALLTTNTNFLVLIVGLGMDAAVVYDVARQKRNTAERLRYLYSVFIAQVLLICGFSILFQYCFGYAYFGYPTPWGVVYAAALLLSNYGVALWNGEKHFRVVYQVMISIYVLAILLFGVIDACRIQLSEAALLKLYIWMNVCIGLWLTAKYVYVHRRDLHFSFRPVAIFSKEWFRFGQLVCWANLFQYLAYRMDIWMVAFFLHKDQLGIYALAEKIIQTLWMIPSSMATVIFAYTDQVSDTAWFAGFLRLLRLVMWCFLLADVVLLFTGDYWMNLLFGPSFRAAWIPLRILLPGATVFVLNILLAAYFAACNRLHINLINSAICCMVIVLCDWWWIPRLGINGAAWASTLGYGISGLLAYLLFFRMHRLSWLAIFKWQPEDVKRLFSFLFR